MTFRVLIKTLLKIIITWFIIVSLSFFLFLAFNPDLAASSLHANRVTVTAAAIKAEKERLGLDKPILNQYGDWLLHLFRGDLGTSYTQRTCDTTHLRSSPQYAFIDDYHRYLDESYHLHLCTGSDWFQRTLA